MAPYVSPSIAGLASEVTVWLTVWCVLSQPKITYTVRSKRASDGIIFGLLPCKKGIFCICIMHCLASPGSAKRCFFMA